MTSETSAAELEALEWGGLLHDVGKIGVPDSVLLKQERLTREERMMMNAHPVLGAQIIAPVTRLAAELPIIRHHHEWYNGSGYPDRLVGDEIPKLARVLHVADAFEAMTASSPWRSTMNSAAPISPRARSRTETSSPGGTSAASTPATSSSTIVYLPSRTRRSAPSRSGSAVACRFQSSRDATHPA